MTNDKTTAAAQTLARAAYRPAEVQAMLGIGNTCFYAMVKKGRLQVTKVGRATLVPAESIARLLAAA